MAPEKMIVRSIRISHEQSEWFRTHESVNVSGLIREFLAKYIDEHDGE